MGDGLRAVLFDFDGTLAYYRPVHIDLYVQAAAAHGVTVTAEALAGVADAAWGPWATPDGVDHAAHSGDEAAFNAIREQLHLARYAAAGVRGADATMQAIALDLSTLESDPQHFALYDDTIAGLERVRAAGLRAYIVSNHVWRLPEIVGALGLGALVDGVLTSARVGFRKPHPAIFRAAMALADEVADALLYVGDHMEHDVRGARAVGMHAVLLHRTRPRRAGPGLTGAGDDARVIRTLMEVPL